MLLEEGLAAYQACTWGTWDGLTANEATAGAGCGLRLGTGAPSRTVGIIDTL